MLMGRRQPLKKSSKAYATSMHAFTHLVMSKFLSHALNALPAHALWKLLIDE